ncbi:MAG: hypothetical protein A2076_09210 [Geobacteraceae bacterium GWC2_53_11]|nr:MAG: hypothetical protein A2076_09210 [Geobacteraceae bacterium GWC2_53_11]
MTIKAKLIANVLVIAAIIAGISQASYISTSFLQKKLSYLTERSTPYQMKTMEFQSVLQQCVTDLISVNAAHNVTEFSAFRAKAVQSLGEVHNTQDALQKMNVTTSRFAVFEELNEVADELISATDARLNSDVAANEVNAKMSQQMKDSSARLKELEAAIRTLQIAHTESFAQALKSTEQYSSNLRNLEELRNTLKELHTVSASALNTHNTTAFLIIKGKAKTLLARIARNKSTTFIPADFKTLADDVNEFLHLSATGISHKDDESKKWAGESYKELTEFLNRLNLALNQEIELASSRLAIETTRQGSIFARSQEANSILLINSELVALSTTITSETNRLFTLDSPEELERVNTVILATFTTIHDRIQRMERSLAKLEADDVLKVLNTAHTSLEAIRSDLNSNRGIVNTLKVKLDAIKHANNSAHKLQIMVLKQSTKGKENISVAQGDQGEAIAAINRMIHRSMSQIVSIGIVAILIGILFGLWIYRSVLLPLRIVLDAVSSQHRQGEEKVKLVEAVAGGDLDRKVSIGTALALEKSQIQNDEIGTVLKAVVGMSETQVSLDRAFADMTVSLRNNRTDEDRRNRLKNGLFELNKILRDEQITTVLADRTLAFIAGFLSARAGIMFQFDAAHELLHPIATFALAGNSKLKEAIRLGEGLVGLAALERKNITLDSVPPGYLTINSALGEAEPLHVSILPIVHNDTLIGIVELGSFKPFSADDMDFLQQSLEGIAIALNINHSRQLVNILLEQTQQQAEELQQTNEELEERTHVQAELQRKQRASETPA